MELEEWIQKLCAIPSVSGRESMAAGALTSLIGGYFDECRTDAVGNCLLIRYSGRQGAPKILLDAHLDEIGMMVTEVLEDGFLRVTNLGGLDARTLQASEVEILGKQRGYGVITAKPPHLTTSKERETLERVEELLVDTGYSKERAEELFGAGTPARFLPSFHKLLNGRIAGTSFDNKACGACAAYAVGNTPRQQLAGDVYLLFSVREESSAASLGAVTGSFAVTPDYAVVIDVDLGESADTPKYETVRLGDGISIAMAASMSRRFVKAICGLCDREEIPYQKIAAPDRTGTNGEGIRLCGEGIPTAVVGLPLRNMHTPNEIISLEDAQTLVRFVQALCTDEEIGREFAR